MEWNMRYLLLTIAILLASPAAAVESLPDASGEVRVPLADYQLLLQQLSQKPGRAPAAYAIGRSDVVVEVRESEDRFAATIDITLQIETFEDQWTLVPILPNGAALNEATLDGQPVRLVQGPDGLAWSTAKAGTFTLQLSYDLDAQRSESGFVLPLPVPVAAATTFSLSFPGSGVDLAVVPSADLRRVEAAGTTHFTASVPATSSILVAWRAAGQRPFAISRATYDGILEEDAVVWSARFQVELFTGEQLTLPVMPSSVTLNDVRVDGQAATVVEEAGRFTTLLQGRGSHEVRVEFQVPVSEDGGPPRARLQIPRIPVSRFDLSLPGKKEVKVAPGANVVTSDDGEGTLATVFIPMSEEVVFTWTDAIPEDLRTQVRANASLYHAVLAEEGVLHGRGTVVYEITHGETNLLELSIPADAQVNRIVAPGGGLLDWAVAAPGPDGRQNVDVFLELPVSGEILLQIAYERLLGGGAESPPSLAVPLISARNVHRQRGMVALLSGQELTLKPVTEEGVTRVGENQLPAFLRNQIDMTVAHTYKYIDPKPNLRVEAVAPERRQGKFDAQVDTLISLGEVTMKGSATVEIDVKSGAIVDLELRLPLNVNVLAVSGPSLRTHQVREAPDGEAGEQAIALEFTREMEGQFRIEVNYERIMEAETDNTAVPTVSVMEAEVEHGRIAVEALTAVEVRATTSEQLSNLDLNELPQQLVLKTTNPILLAYRYVSASPPFKLALKITRHREIDVQVAAIERADYSSLFTRDGLSVTTARLMVRNSRRQFLRLDLPPGSQVWSVFVDGKPEKPAYAGEGTADENAAVLVKMINSSEGFPVEIVYATPAKEVGILGNVGGRLPRPDMVVTHTRWTVFLPVGPRYYSPDSTMDIARGGGRVSLASFERQAAGGSSEDFQTQMGQPLKINVPRQGVLFAFEKLYANQSAQEAAFSVRYVSEDTNYAGMVLSALGALLVWAGIVALGSRRFTPPRQATIAAIGTGVALLLLTIGYLGTTPLPASILAILVALLLAVWWIAGRLRAWYAGRAAA
jgi:hypothetical protein